MIETDHTKQFLARSLIQLMREAPLESIPVAKIAENCGLNRHTFYYHFKDKQDLVCWIFDCDVNQWFEMPSQNDIKSGRDIFYLRRIIDFMYENKAFYISAFNASGQNSLHEHLYDFIYIFREKQIDAILNGRLILPEAKRFLADYYTCAIYGMIIRWVRNNMQNPPEVFFKGYRNVAFQSMEFLINGYLKEM